VEPPPGRGIRREIGPASPDRDPIADTEPARATSCIPAAVDEDEVGTCEVVVASLKDAVAVVEQEPDDVVVVAAVAAAAAYQHPLVFRRRFRLVASRWQKHSDPTWNVAVDDPMRSSSEEEEKGSHH